ncbi:MAG: alanine racemase [Sphingomonadaceae bacterium]|nr:alanine racemase [Sphingomonadaceae bacterium]
MPSPAPLRLRLDGAALVDNWRALDRLSGSAICGAAVKADGYGIGAREAVERLAGAGCRDFFVATWGEAAELAPWYAALSLSVFHGVREGDMAAALAGPARPCLCTREQVRRWRDAGGGVCDAMVDTGMNRLGLAVEDVRAGLLDGLAIDTLMSHLACSDESGNPKNAAQREAFASLVGRTLAKRLSLANSAGIALGPDYAFDLTRPGLSLYGGVQVEALAPHIRQVAHLEAEIIQRRRVEPGDTVGYNATFTASAPIELAILNIGYADGYARGFSGRGRAFAEGAELPVVGRVSMDLVAIAVDAAPRLAEGDWVELDFDLPAASAQSGIAQYELLTGLGDRYQRVWK